jgi:multiple sugar transport system substrate-binding protein
MQGVWFPNFIRRHRPHMEFGVAPFPIPQRLMDESLKAHPGSKPADNKWIRSQMEADMLALAKSCRHPKEAWKFLLFTQKATTQIKDGKPHDVLPGLVTLCKLQGKHMPIVLRPQEFISGHPNRELAVFEDLAASPYSFIAPRLTIWTEYRDQVNRAFEGVWAWKPPAESLAGLEGAARQRKVDDLCREEIRRVFGEVRVTMQAKLDRQNELKMRRGEVVSK